MSIIKMWLFLKHYDGAQPGKRKTTSATPAENVREKQAKYEKGVAQNFT
jgi:hypothetical protein